MIRLLLTFAILLIACSEQPGWKLNNANESLHYSLCYKPSNWINLERMSVLEYVELLKIKERKMYSSYTLDIFKKAKTDWVTESDLNYLITLIESEEDAMGVRQVICSDEKECKDTSSLGGQVLNIIDAYRLNEQYPNFLMKCSGPDSARVQEIKKWWEERSKQ